MNTKEQANTSLSETGPLRTTSDAVDYLMQTMPNIQEDTSGEEAHEELQTEQGEAYASVQEEEIQPEVEAQADDNGEEVEEYEEETIYEEDGEDYVLVGEEEIPVSEVAKSYERQADYTRKMQKLAKERKDLESQQTQFQQEMASIEAERNHLRQVLESFGGEEATEEIDWVELAENDPLEYTRQKALHDAKAAKSEAAKAEKERLKNLELQKHKAQFGQFVEKQKKMVVEAIPEVAKDPKYMANVETYMEGSGYSKEELTRMFDARVLIMADKARKFDEMTSTNKPASKKRVKPKGRVLKPSTQKTKAQKMTKQKADARAKARRTGTVNDAVAALLS